jgi:hypothetical protein
MTTKSVEIGTATAGNGGIHADLVAGLSLLVADGKRLSGFALDETVEPLLLGAVDTTGRPLYVDLATDVSSSATARPGRLLSRPSFMGPGVGSAAALTTAATPTSVKVVAFGGDWTQAAWGVVGGVQYDVSTEASITLGGVLTSLWEHNLVAIRAEAEFGFIANDTAAFVRYTNNT